MYFDFSQANFSFAPLVLDMLNFLMDAIQTNFQQASAVGSSSRAQQALSELHTVDKVVEMTDQLMVSMWGLHGLVTTTCVSQHPNMWQSNWNRFRISWSQAMHNLESVVTSFLSCTLSSVVTHR